MAGKGGKRSTSFKPGQVANPRGPKPGLTKDIRALAQTYAPAALEALAEALKNKGERVAAANVLLNRGYGMPKQDVDLKTNLAAARSTDAALLAVAIAGGSVVAAPQDDTSESDGVVH